MRRINIYLLVFSLALISLDKFFLFNKIRIPAITVVQSFFIGVKNTIHDYSNSVHEHYLETRRLRKENIFLKSKIQKISLELQNTKNEKNDASKIYALLNVKYPHFNPLLAKLLVSPNFVNKDQLFLSFDEQQGKVKVSNVVINQNGVIGQVVTTRPGYAIVNFLSNPAFKIYVQNDEGVKLLLQGNGNDSMIINYVGISTKIAVGDILYTTGLDNIYPGHLPVAQVTSIKHTSNFMTITCQTIVKKDSIDFAMILI